MRYALVGPSDVASTELFQGGPPRVVFSHSRRIRLMLLNQRPVAGGDHMSHNGMRTPSVCRNPSACPNPSGVEIPALQGVRRVSQAFTTSGPIWRVRTLMTSDRRRSTRNAT